MNLELIEKLKQRLAHPLPGDEAHSLMMPRLPSGSGIRFKNNKEPRQGAVLILLYQKFGKYHFPLIQRPVYQGVHSGQVALPGGKYDETDQDLYHTALREAEEEVGIDPGQVEILGTLSEFFVAASNHLVLPVIGYTEGPLSFVADPVEVDEVIEAPLDHLLDETRRKETQIKTTQGHKLFSPYFDLEGKVVWGATAMMLSEFVEIVREI